MTSEDPKKDGSLDLGQDHEQDLGDLKIEVSQADLDALDPQDDPISPDLLGVIQAHDLLDSPDFLAGQNLAAQNQINDSDPLGLRDAGPIAPHKETHKATLRSPKNPVPTPKTVPARLSLGETKENWPPENNRANLESHLDNPRKPSKASPTPFESLDSESPYSLNDDLAFGLAEPETTENPNDSGPKFRPTARSRRLTRSKPVSHSPEEANNRPAKKRSLFGRLCRAALWAGSSLALLGLAVSFIGYAWLSQDLPSVEGLKIYQPKTVTFFYSADGQIIGEYSHERRLVRPLSEIPLLVRQAFIAVEDANFYNHGGVNLLAVARAAYHNLTSDTLQGASTITQQVARSFFLTREKKFIRKLKEIILAFRLEGTLSKDEILYLYLNQIYLGQGAYGVEAAAQTYFDKNVERLTVAEAAMLAGVTQSPEGKNPLKQPQEARARQLYGLKRLVEVGSITPQQAQAAREEVLNVVGDRPNPNTTVAPYFTEHVRKTLAARFGEESLYNDGWRVFTTLDVKAQEAADLAVARGLWEYARRRGFKGPINHLSEAAIPIFLAKEAKNWPYENLPPGHLYQAVILGRDAEGLEVAVGSFPGRISNKNFEWIGKALAKKLDRGDVVWVRPSPAENFAQVDREKALASLTQESGPASSWARSFILENQTDVQAALLSLDTSTGAVVAMVGGRDFRESQFNRATQSQRQPGSSFKPIVYASALDNGFTPGSILIDGPVVIDDPGSGKRWKPVNSDRKFLGPMSLYSALVASRNLVTIKILERIGFEALDKTARDLGITDQLPHSTPVALGAHGVPMPELLSAYTAFANMGQRVTPRYITRIEDRYGRVVATFEPEKVPALDPGTACAITWMLRGVVAQGTGTSVRPLNRPVAGKTGTTNDASDAWFVGFTPELATAVWLGTDELKPRAVNEVGGRAAGPIFLYYNQTVLKDRPIVDFQAPPEAQIAPGGAFGICYKAGTIGAGISETQMALSLEEDFLRAEALGENELGLDNPNEASSNLTSPSPPEETFLEEMPASR